MQIQSQETHAERRRGAIRVRPGREVGSARAFTLIEFLGVLAVIAILAGLLFPVVVRRVDIAAVNAEGANLDSLSNALVLQVFRSNSIPSEAAWFQAMGNWLSYPPASITNNARRYARAYLVDTNGWLGANLPATGYYSQPATGTVISTSARILLVSSLSAALPVATGRPSMASFNNIWNTTPKTIPSTWPTTWRGRGDDLLIQRINLQPLFNKLVLVNRDTNNAAAYVLAGRTNLVTSHSISNAWYINGTVVGLGSTNSGSTRLQTSYVLDRNLGYVFENGYWSGQIGTGPNLLFTNIPVGLNFNNLAQAFLALPVPYDSGSPTKSGDQQQVMSAMIDFMIVYQLWAFNPHGRFTTYNIGATGMSHDSI